MTVTLTLPPDVEDAIQEAARRNGRTTEETVAEALRTLFPPREDEAPREEAEGEQARLRAVFAELRAAAHVLVTDRAASRAAAQDDPVVEAVADKFRRQGFHL